MTQTIVAIVTLVALAGAWRLLRYWTPLYLWLNDAIEVSVERAPTAFAAFTNLALAIDRSRPYLYVMRGSTVAASAFRQSGRQGVVLTEALLDRLSALELRGAVALLLALLASPGAW